MDRTKRVILKESTKVLDRIRMYKIYLMCSFEGTILLLKDRGLVKWYDRGLQNLWWEFDSLIPCTLGAWKLLKGIQALLFCPKRADKVQQIGSYRRRVYEYDV